MAWKLRYSSRGRDTGLGGRNAGMGAGYMPKRWDTGLGDIS